MLLRSLANQVTFQNAAAVTGNGQAVSCLGYKTLVIEIFGTSAPAGTVSFQAAGPSGNFAPITGTKLNGLTQATSTVNIPSGTPPQPEQWQFDVSALDQFMCPLTWTAGQITVQGRLMA